MQNNTNFNNPKNQNQTYNDVMSKLQDYILDDKNIAKSLETRNTTHNKRENEVKNNIKQKNKIFIPKEKDTLFWCFYIIKNGEVKYETLLHRNEVVAKQIKISYVEKIRSDKQNIKTYKFDSISNIESNLANDNAINCKTFLTLCVIENINVIYITKKTYFELLMNDSEDIFIIYEINNSANGNYHIKHGFEQGTKETVNTLKNTLYRVDKIDKPIKAISSYSVQELVDICNKLAIETTNKDTNKTKTKKDLYEGIIQFF